MHRIRWCICAVVYPSNIRYSKRFFQLYSPILENFQQVAENLKNGNLQQVAEKFSKSYRMV